MRFSSYMRNFSANSIVSFPIPSTRKITHREQSQQKAEVIFVGVVLMQFQKILWG